MAERVADLLTNNPDESFFFAFGAGKNIYFKKYKLSYIAVP